MSASGAVRRAGATRAACDAAGDPGCVCTSLPPPPPSFELLEPRLHAIETPLGFADIDGRVAKSRNGGVHRQRLLEGVGGARKVVALLGHPLELLSGPGQRVAAGAIAVGQLRRLTLARVMTVLLGLIQRVSATIHVLETVDERARETEKRIRPVASKPRGLAKGHDRGGEFLLRLGLLSTRLAGFAVDP